MDLELNHCNFREEIGELSQLEFKSWESFYNQYSLEDTKEQYERVETMIESAINDSNRRTAYSFDSKMHGERHIQDVILFTGLVGQNSLIGDNKEKLLILTMEASKYHDSGRNHDSIDNHAKAGAIKAFEILKKENIYNYIELAMIYTTILQHDMYGTKEQIKELSIKELKDSFMSIIKTGFPYNKAEYTKEEYQAAITNTSFVGDIKTNNIDEDINQMVTLVRDADALDRTRFSDSSIASLRPTYISEEAQKYIDFSYTLAEYHAMKDILQMKEIGMIDDDFIRRIKEEQAEYAGKEITTNKELIKFINIYLNRENLRNIKK